MSNKKDTKNNMFKALLYSITNPIFILVYAIAWYHLSSIAQYGNKTKNLPILLLSLIFFIAWPIVYAIKTRRASASYESKTTFLKGRTWTAAALVILLAITVNYGVKVYHSGINYNGKLAWFLSDLKNKRTVSFKKANLYEDGLEGLISTLDEKFNIPENLYISSSFDLRFSSDGTITYIDTFVYGKNNEGITKSYLISYDSSKSNKLTLYLDGYVTEDYSEYKLLQPLIDTIKVIPFKEDLKNWNQEEYGILYSGDRSFGYNTEGIRYIDFQGNTQDAQSAYSELKGYFVSLYVPDNESSYPPIRYLLTEDLTNIAAEDPSSAMKNPPPKQEPQDNSLTSYISNIKGYRLTIVDAALGSRFFNLEKTEDEGKSWTEINKDPFLGNTGGDAGIKFIDESHGFIILSKSGGSYGELYRTEDSGLSFTKVELPEPQLNDTSIDYIPFDFPEPPFIEEDKLILLVGQGQDGDYNGGSKGKYESLDMGRTWTYIAEVKE
ncbi:WD40/YVTN/BNR-like repeat-containing protein [Alloiococcus sp. CFN-8]|uniref:WD40/YVTN/BNR-like repeat-containing protein n=1 Tax=Alloiococcus sp. CFN-8 TaxID=3416081 RepID=UPI003CF0E5CF